MTDKKPLVILAGPTSVGKTSLSVALAKAIGGEIISADSMQVYRHMDIGTAKITPREMDGVPHHLIDEFEPEEEFHVVRFQQLAKQYIGQIYERGRLPILVGGTGFYIQAVLYDIDFAREENDISYRKELEELLKDRGSEYLHDKLKAIDPDSAEAIHPNNGKRVIRALEYARQTGNKISEHNTRQRGKESPYQFCYFVLNEDRSALYDKINRRVDRMMKQGLLEEVKLLYTAGYSRELTSMQGLGYKELLAYLNGECSLEEAVDLLKRDTRHFAKRQLTWFKREKEVIWVDKDAFQNDEELLYYLISCLRTAKIIP